MTDWMTWTLGALAAAVGVTWWVTRPVRDALERLGTVDRFKHWRP